ncbi:DHH family phosphoesterase [bacterium]|nr:DHH family phosphoesterase [bacterium]
MEYLKNLLKIDKWDEIPELTEFFDEYSKKLEQKNSTIFNNFIQKHHIKYENRDELTKILNKMIYEIEKKIEKSLYISDYSKTETIERIFLFGNCYIDFYHGLFLKEEAARDLILGNPLLMVKKEIGTEFYEDYIKNNPMLLLAIGRFSEPPQWNETLKNMISDLNSSDFELREPDFAIVNHKIFKESAWKIIKKKCFNTHDKLLGLHIATTIPPEFSLEGKSPILRTVTKMMHYHKEMQLFNEAFRSIQKRFPELLVSKVQQMMKEHIFDANASLFNTNDVLEGISNRYIDKQIHKLAIDFLDLTEWAEIHDTTHLINGEPFSLSLWRLTSWGLNGTLEHTIKMFRDDTLANMLVDMFGEDRVEKGTVISLLDSGDSVYQSIKRANYFSRIKEIEKKNYTEAIVLHHNDADGISSGFIIEQSLKTRGTKVYRYVLEIIFPEAVDIILNSRPDIPIFIVDLGTQISHHLISKKETRDIVIIDHHKYDQIEFPKNYFVLNPRDFGLNADEEGASSINAYFYSAIVCETTKYAAIGLIGSVGDGMLSRNGKFLGLDQYALTAAIAEEAISFENEEYFFKIHNHKYPLIPFVKENIDVLGSVGFQNRGVDLALDLLEGKIMPSDPRINAIKELKAKKYNELIEYFAINGFVKTKHFYCFNVEDKFSPMGLKEIGNFLSYLIKNSDNLPFKLDLNRYFLGAQTVTSIQGIGDVTKEPSYKISMRVGKILEKRVKSGDMPDFFEITHLFKHIPGGIHSMSAAVVIEQRNYSSVLNGIELFLNDFEEDQ